MCVGYRCICNNGFKACNGACIAIDACCGPCPGDRECAGGDCACPADAPFACPGDDLCFAERPECCDTATCPGDKECIAGRCVCRQAGAIDCVESCCDEATEVCNVELEAGEIVRSCQPGGCPATDFCVEGDTERYFCALDSERICLCTSTVDLIPGRVCVDFFSLGDESCEACDTSSDCGTGRVCVADGPLCGCGVNYCVRVCPAPTGNNAGRGAGGTPVDREKHKVGVRKRRRQELG